jgi:hypothetical protein
VQWRGTGKESGKRRYCAREHPVSVERIVSATAAYADDAAEASSVMYTLVARKRVPESIGKLCDTLRDAGKLLAHSPTLPDEREASEYVRQTSFLKRFLELLKQTMNSKADKSGNE